MNNPLATRYRLWVDAVGGFLLCLQEDVVLGLATGEEVDVPLLADISRRQAILHRESEGYWIEPVRHTRVDARLATTPTPLRDGSCIELGSSVRLRFRLPHPYSLTARLEFESCHRTQPRVDSVLLMADSCILGPGPRSHIVCPNWEHEMVLFRSGVGFACRSRVALTVDGAAQPSPVQVPPGVRVAGDNFSWSLETAG